jgi:hypothetical protein
LSSRAADVAGGAVGYQKFFGVAKRRQVISELGYRLGTNGTVGDSAAASVRYQHALGRRFVLVMDGFGGFRETPGESGDESLFGGRFECVVKF